MDTTDTVDTAVRENPDTNINTIAETLPHGVWINITRSRRRTWVGRLKIKGENQDAARAEVADISMVVPALLREYAERALSKPEPGPDPEGEPG